jgi:hypothetical protein
MKRTWNLDEAGFDYHVVAVFGSQSTGKSNIRPYKQRRQHIVKFINLH